MLFADDDDADAAVGKVDSGSVDGEEDRRTD